MDFYLSASCKNALEDYIKQSGFNRLFSFYVDKNSLENYFNYPDKVFLDSGAFSAMRKDIPLDIDVYCDFINKYYVHYSVIAALDIIGKTDDCSDKNLDNYKYMGEHLCPDAFSKVIPTFHFGENLKYLERLCNTSSYIALGGIAPVKNTAVRNNFLQECFSIIPKTHKVHLFGVSTLELLDKYWERIYSADSSTWYFAAINGELISDYGRLIVSENRNMWDKQVVNYVERQGYSFEKLSTDVEERIKFNLDFLRRWLNKRETQNNPYRGLTQLNLF